VAIVGINKYGNQRIKVANFVAHSKYFAGRLGTFHYNLALLRLKKDIVFYGMSH